MQKGNLGKGCMHQVAEWMPKVMCIQLCYM